MRVRSATISLVFALTGLALMAPGANAAQVLLQGGTNLRFIDLADETNVVTLDRSGNVYTVTDTGAPISAMFGCTNTGPNSATCPVDPVTDFSLELGNLNDRATVGPAITGDQLDLSVSAGDGNDIVNAGPNFEFGQYFGGAGNDTMNGGPENDRLGGGDGNDTLLGAAGNDSLEDDDGNDVMNGGVDNDRLSAGNGGPDGSDVMVGGPGEFDDLDFRRTGDVFLDLNGVADDGENCPGAACEKDNVAPDFERIDTGDGNDVVRAGPGSTEFFAGAGHDLVDGQGGNDFLLGDDGDDSLSGGPGDDNVNGGSGEDRHFGGPGDDRLRDSFGIQPDLFSGGRGLDLVDFDGAAGPVRIDLDNQADDGRQGEGDNVRTDVEDVVGSSSPDVIVGSKAANDFTGGDGRDRLVGRGGADGLIGGGGGDLLIGGKASDFFDGGAGPDSLRARDRRRDEVRCGAARDVVRADAKDRRAADCDKVRVS